MLGERGISASETAAASYAAAAVEKIDCGDAVLALRRYGSGPPLMLVHGFPLHGYTWRKVLPALARQHTCLVVDLAGLGDSEWSAATAFNFEDHARRLKTLADKLGLQRYSLMAQDTGATVARCLALADGARVDKLILINTEMPGHRPPWIVPYQYAMRWLPGTKLSFKLLMQSRAFLRSGMGFGGCFKDLGLIEGDFSVQFVRPYIESKRRMDGLGLYLGGLYWDTVDGLRERHAQLKMPVLLIWGEDDPTFPIALVREMAKQIPDCRLVAIPGARLLVHEERPDEVTKAALPFLAVPLAP